MAIQDAITALAAIQRAAFPGFTAHVHMPESLNPPCFTNVPADFQFGMAAQGLSAERYTVRTDLVISRHEGGGLAGADAKLRPYLQQYWDRVWLAHLTLDGTIEGFWGDAFPVTGSYGVIIAHASVEYLAISFTQQVKIKRTVKMEA